MSVQSACSSSPLHFLDQKISDPNLPLGHSNRASASWARGRHHTWMIVSLAVALLSAGAISARAQAPTLQGGWTQQSPGTVPPGRSAPGLVYDSATSQVVMFGGSDLNDTWVWNGTNWSNVTPASNNPPARRNMAMAYDATTRGVVMFGGNESATFGDTWLWHGTSWVQISGLSTVPPARSNAFMAYDAATGTVVMFGGADANGDLLNDTWLWDGKTWAPASPSTSPSARIGASMAYDSALGEVILFGGFDGNYDNDVWAWDGTTWTQVSPANSAPSGRFGAAMAYDAAAGQVVIFGGVNGNGWTGETWVLAGPSIGNLTWIQQTGTGPSARNVSGMDYDAAQSQIVLFGGEGTSGDQNDTWTWQPPQNFGNINVCSGGSLIPCSNTLALTYNFTTTTNLGTPQVVTQGATGLDFGAAAGNTCTGTISAGNSCTVNVTFTPLAPGLREGAVNLLDSLGNLLASTPVYGIGQGAVAAFSPLSTEMVNTGPLTGPKGVLVDASGDLFVSDYDGHKVVEVGPSTSNQVVTVAQSPQLNSPQDLAMDGAGNLYVADVNLHGVVKIQWGCIVTGSSTCQQMVANPLNLTGQFGVSADAHGDVFVSSYDQGEVVEVPADGGPQTVVYTGNTPIGTVEDAAGDLFVADSNNKAVVEVPAGCTSSSCYLTIGSNWSSPNSVALDAAGDLYIVDGAANQEVVEFPAGCTTNTCAITIADPSFPSLGANFKPYDAVTDAQGNVYIGDYGNQRVDAILQQFAGLSFSASIVGNISGDSPLSVLFQNVGNQPLTATAPGLQFTDPDFYQTAGTGTPADCSATFSLAAGAACNLSVDFDPLTAGSLSGTAVFTDNAFNAAAATQSLALSGTGQAPPSYTLTVTALGSGSGAVTDGAEALNCTIAGGNATGTCSESYTSGQVVTLFATPNASSFGGWGGACASYGTNTQCQVTMSSAMSVTVSFSALPLAFTAPTTMLNTTSATQTATVNITAGGTLGEISVVTQGAVGKDYNFVSGGTCAVGTFYSAGQTCTVNYTFSPLAPGGRNGGVLLTDDSLHVLGTSYLTGIGTGPQGLFDTTPQTLSISGLNIVRGLSVDGNGNLYGLETNGSIDEFPAGTSTVVQLASVPAAGNSGGTAVDGAGNLWVATTLGNLYELVGGNGPANLVTTIPISDNNLEIDGAGNLYFSGYAGAGTGYIGGAIYEIPAGTTSVTTLIPSAHQRFIGMGIDAAGNLFAADYYNNILYELPAGTNSLVTLSSGGYLSGPHGVAVDPAGNIYVANVNGSAVIRYAAGTYTSTLLPEAGERGIALDSAGNMYTITSDSTIAGYTRAQASPLSFPSTNVGNTSDSLQGDLFVNGGNAALVITGYSAPAPFALGGAQNTCAVGTLRASASCVVGATFTPTSGGIANGTGTITDNNLQVTETEQNISLSGTGVAVGSYALTVTPIGLGSGTVTDGSLVINCSESSGNPTGACSGDYQSGTSVILTANPAPGSIFLGWGGACGGFAPTCELTMIQAYNVTASFAQQNFGSVNVCQQGQSTPAPCSTSIPVTINIPTTTTIGAVQVVTQGVSGLDFTQGSGGTCIGTIPGATACNVNVNFAPLAPGLRRGAVNLYDNNGNLIATTLVYGVGQAPMAGFSPSQQTTVPGTGLTQPYGLAVDAAGDVFIGEPGANLVLKVTPGGSQTTVGTITGHPYGLAVDGAGDVFIAELNNNRVVEVTPSGVQTTVPASGLTQPIAVAVDGAGNLFISDRNNNRVVELPAGCRSAACQITLPTVGLNQPYGLALDATGDVFIADYNNNRVIEVTPSGVQSTVPTNGLTNPYGVAVDAAGDVFVVSYINNRVIEVTPNGAQITVAASGLNGPAGLALDGAGDILISDYNNNRVVEVQSSLPPSLSFAFENVGSPTTDRPQIVTLQDIGNQPLSGSTAFNTGASFFANSTCSPSFDLLPGATCSTTFVFSPRSGGYLTGSATFSDNTFNLSPLVSLQTVNVSGTGGVNGQPVALQVPNVVGLAQTAASTSITGTGLTVGTVSTASNSVVPSGSVIASNPAAGTVVNPASAVNLLISTGQAAPVSPNPLTLLNNYFVTGDYAAAGVTLRGSGAGNPATGIITIPDSTTSPGSQGVPDGADIIDGFLYWTTLETSASPSGNTATFLGYPITGQQIGSDTPYTDGALNGTLRVYRADVNAYFPVRQDGSGLRTGSGAFSVSFVNSGGTLTEGASLVELYRVLSPNFPLKSVVIYDGSAIPASSSDENMKGFYDALGGATGESTALSYAGGSWSSSSTSVSLAAHASQYSAPLNAGTAYAAEILSTPVTNSDNDGILDAWKAGPAAGDFYAGQPGYYDVKTGQWVPLPGATHGEKDLFVQLDYMCGAVLADGSCDPALENLFPAPDAQGNDPLAMVKNAFATDGVVLHLEIGNAVPESTCTDSTSTNPPQLCQFPSEPGVIGWKDSLEFSKVWPKNLTSCVAGGDCSPRFPYGQKDSYHYVLFGHSLAIPAWNSRYGTLTAISVANNVTTITTTNRGAQGGINYCPSRITIAGVLGNPALNGVYNTTSCSDSQHITVATPGVTNWTYPNSTMPEPEIGITFGTVTSISGYSDLGGADSAVTLGLWETYPNQDMSKRVNVLAGTLFHEIGHTLGLTHGGLYYDHYSVGSPSYVPTFEENCKPNFQSIMNYLFQLDGVGPTAAVALSNQALQTLTSSSLGSVTSLTDGSSNPATFPTSAWYSPTAPSPTASAATLHCDGTPLTGDTGYRVNGSVVSSTPLWSNGQNITFDGVPPGGSIPFDPLPYTTLRGYNDVANLDLRQVGATGGEFASFASAMPFGSFASQLNIAPGGSVAVSAGGTVALGSGGTVTLGSGGNVTLGSGGTIALGSGGSVTLNQAGNVTLGSGGTITLGSGGTVALGSGGTVALGSGGTITLGSGGTVALGSGGTVTLGSGGTIALGSGGTVTIPSTGGSYTLDSSGGTITLGSGGTVALGSGGTVTLGSGGTIAMGSGGTVALGSGGTVALGSGGTVTLGSGGTITLGSGGNVTLGSGGTVTLGSGGTVTMGSGGTIALGSGGTVTLGSGGTVALGSGGTVALGSGGNVTLGSGGTIALGSGGTVALGSGGNVTLGSGGTIALGSGGTVTLGSGGTVTLGSGGTITLGSGGTPTSVGPGTYTLGAGGTVTLGSGGTVALGSGGNVTLGSGGTITMGSGGTVTLGSGGTVTLGSGGTITMGSGGTVTLGSGGTVTLGSGGTVALGSGGTVALGSGGTIALGSGGNVTLGSGGASTTELDYNTANSVVRPPISPTYTLIPGGSIQVNWMAPAFGVVQTYTISRSVNGGPPVVIGSVSGVNGNAPATTFTDTNPPLGTLVYTIATTLVPDTPNSTPRQSGPSAPAVLTVNQTIVLGALPSSVSISGPPVTVTATAQSNGVANGLMVSFNATGSCSAGSPSMNPATGISSAIVTLNSTGTCTIIASQAGNSTMATGATAYNAANPVSATFTILPPGSATQSQTISFGTLPSVQYGGGGFSVSATASSGLPVTFSAPAGGACSVGPTAGTANGTASAAGVCRITASQAGNGTYSAASVTQLLPIAPAVLTVAANPVTIFYGQQFPALSYTFGPLVNGDSLTSAVSGTPTLSTTATSTSNAGTYPITVSTGSLAAANYDFLYVPGNVVVNPATTATTVVSSSPSNQSNYMQLVTFTATVVDNSPSSRGAAPTGSVSFFSNGTQIGTGTLVAVACGTPPCASQATLSTASLSAGADTITASYSGDAGTGNGDGLGNYSPSSQSGSTATGLTQTVAPAPIANVNPASLSFGNTNVGKTTSGMTITLSNTGDAALALGSGRFMFTGPNAADFAETDNCPASLGSNSGSNSCTITVTFTPSDTGVETATLQITDNDGNLAGAQQFVALTGSGLSTIAGTSVFTDAIFANAGSCGAISLSGGASINSFNSIQGYSSSKQNSGGNVGTNGNVTVGGGATIYGTAALDALTTGKCSSSSVTGLTTSGSGSVTGGLVALNGPVNYPAPSAPNPAPPTTNQSVSGSCPSGMTGCSSAGSKAVSLAPGEYGNVTAGGGTTVHLSRGTYDFNSLKMGGGSVLHVDSGPVIVHLAGASVSGSNPVLDFTGGDMENPTGIPGNLQFTYGGSQSVNLAGGANAYATVYAPNAVVTLSGGADFFGSITASAVTSSGGTSIHYDNNLPSIQEGSTIWFTVVVNNVKGLPANQQTKLYMSNGSISFTANGFPYSVPVPNAVLTLNSASGTATTYDLTNNRWSTSIAASNLTGNTFISGVAFPVPVAMPAGIQNVKWSASFSTDTPGVTLQWQWNAEVYTQFSQTYATTANSNVLGVNPEDGSADANGTDPAGTPESFKQYATFGATDGYFSAPSGVVPTAAQVSVSPSSLSFGNQTVGTTSGALMAVVTNNYSTAFTISSISVSGANAADFIESDNCPRTSGGLASNCTVSVTFKPSSAAPESAKVVINDTANNSPQTVYLTGTGH